MRLQECEFLVLLREREQLALLSVGPGFVIPELRAFGYSRGGLAEPACGKRASAVTLSGVPVLMGFPARLIGSALSPQWKTKHMASFLGARLQLSQGSCCLGTKEAEMT